MALSFKYNNRDVDRSYARKWRQQLASFFVKQPAGSQHFDPTII